MSTLHQIAHRHARDRWKDALFIAAALLLTGLSLASLTSRVAGTHERAWTVTVVEDTPEIVR